jgi:hypothetical protein
MRPNNRREVSFQTEYCNEADSEQIPRAKDEMFRLKKEHVSSIWPITTLARIWTGCSYQSRNVV